MCVEESLPCRAPINVVGTLVMVEMRQGYSLWGRKEVMSELKILISSLQVLGTMGYTF